MRSGMIDSGIEWINFYSLFFRGSILAIDLAGWVVQNQVNVQNLTMLTVTRCSGPFML